MPCPIHGGDNPFGCCLFISDNNIVPTWKCYTHHCEERYGKLLINFIIYLLKKNKYETIDWLVYDLNDSKDISEELNFIKSTKILDRKKNETEKITRNNLLKSIKTPSEYYLKRNFSKKILLQYDIGEYIGKKPHLQNRVIVPIYDKERKYVIGYTHRSIFDKCVLCDYYHDYRKPCPTNYLFQYSKWSNSPNFPSENYFYNYWFAKEYFDKKKKIFLVEGQSDVWRFAEIDIYNVLGCFSSVLKDGQKITLEKSGISEIITFTDPDDAGKKFREQIERDVGRIYNINHIEYNKDPSDCDNNELYNLVRKYL